LFFNNRKVHFIANETCFSSVIGNGILCVTLPNRIERKNTLGVIFNILIKNNKNGSKFFFNFKLYCKIEKKLKAFNLHPRKINEPKNLL
jgi:hypothetical protein